MMRDLKLLIKKVRKEKGLSLRQLSRESGVAVSYLSELENEYSCKKNPTILILCKIAHALQVTPESLYEYRGYRM